MRGLAFRRQQKERMKVRAKKVQKRWWGTETFLRGHECYTEEELDEAASRLADNIKCCSCWICGNPRKHLNELTLQERRREEEDRKEISKWNS